MNILVRLGLSLVAVGLVTLLDVDTNAVATIASANFAGMQFDDSNTSAVIAHTGMLHTSLVIGLSNLVLLGVLIGLWFKPLKEFFTNV